MNSSHKWPVTRKMFHFDDVIMMACCLGFERWTMFYSNPLTAVAVIIRWLQSWTYFLSGFSGYWWNFGPCGWMKRVRSNNLNNLLHSKAQHVTVKNKYQAHLSTWSETYFRQDRFPAHVFSRRQFLATVFFRLKSIYDIDSGSPSKLYGDLI